MESSSIQTAATYVNNLLLARGLLRHGKPVEFAELATYMPTNNHDQKTRATPASAVVADIINLVHDLILKRDRDHEQHEALAFTLRTLRTDASRSTAEMDKLKTRNQELRRQVALSESAQRTAEAAARSAEAAARTLKDEVAKVKTWLVHVRTQCAHDVRKRDVQIQNLKKHLSERQRGSKTGVTGPSITIRPGAIGMAKGAGGVGPLMNDDGPNLADQEYSLRQETTEFLTQLSQGLSDENDSLIALIRGTVSTLKELQGLPHNQPRKETSHSGKSTQKVDNKSEELVNVSEVSQQALSRDLEGVLASLTELLTNPSFAPIEEVHVREEEIQRLRAGWEKMESRWHEAVVMMQGWRKRMLSGGDTVKLDELKMGLCLGDGLESPSRKPFDLLESKEGVDPEEEEDDDDDDGVRLASEEPEQAPDVNDLPPVEDSLELKKEKPLFEPREKQQSKSHHGPSEVEHGVLAETTANTTLNRHERETTSLDMENSSPLPARPNSKAISANVNQSRPPKSRLPSRKAPVPNTRATRPARSSPAPEPDLSIEEKLRIAEQEARRVSSSSPLDSSKDINNVDKKKQAGTEGQSSRVGSLRDVKAKGGSSPIKRTRVAGRPKRRKSTLSPEELEALMGR